MSLKAQIEAIIYAAEEPVTVDQLLTLLKEDIVAMEEASRNHPTDPGSDDARGQLAAGAWTAEAPSQAPEGEFRPADHSPDDDSSDAASPDAASLDAASANENAEEPSSDPEAVAPEGEILNPKKAHKEETKRYKQLIRDAVDRLIADYASSDRGIEVREVAGGYRMSTKPEHHDLVRSFAKGLKPPIKLSLPALETLAVIAYKQPVTAPEISEIRGVDSSGVLSSLISRKLITTAGRKQVVGRPILYKTTKEFLMRFGLKDINELPSMEEFEKLTAQAEMFDPSIDDNSAADAETPEAASNSVEAAAADETPVADE